MTTLPESYRARLKDLTILVVRHGSHGMWAWVITRNGDEAGKHDPVMPFNDNEHGAKLEAVTAAARILRMPGGPKDILATLEWETFPIENRARRNRTAPKVDQIALHEPRCRLAARPAP